MTAQGESLQYLLYRLCWQWQACAIVNQILQGRSSGLLYVHMYLIKLYLLYNKKLFSVDLTGGTCGFIFSMLTQCSHNTILTTLLGNIKCMFAGLNAFFLPPNLYGWKELLDQKS